MLILNFRQFFLQRSLREKWLILLAISAGAVWLLKMGWYEPMEQLRISETSKAKKMMREIASIRQYARDYHFVAREEYQQDEISLENALKQAGASPEKIQISGSRASLSLKPLPADHLINILSQLEYRYGFTLLMLTVEIKDNVGNVTVPVMKLALNGK